MSVNSDLSKRVSWLSQLQVCSFQWKKHLTNTRVIHSESCFQADNFTIPQNGKLLYPGSTQSERDSLMLTHEQLKPYIEDVYKFFGDKPPPRAIVVQEALADAFAHRREAVQNAIRNVDRRRAAFMFLDHLENSYKRLHAITREGREMSQEVLKWEELVSRERHDELAMIDLLYKIRIKIRERNQERGRRIRARKRAEEEGRPTAGSQARSDLISKLKKLEGDREPWKEARAPLKVQNRNVGRFPEKNWNASGVRDPQPHPSTIRDEFGNHERVRVGRGRAGNWTPRQPQASPGGSGDHLRLQPPGREKVFATRRSLNLRVEVEDKENSSQLGERFSVWRSAPDLMPSPPPVQVKSLVRRTANPPQNHGEPKASSSLINTNQKCWEMCKKCSEVTHACGHSLKREVQDESPTKLGAAEKKVAKEEEDELDDPDMELSLEEFWEKRLKTMPERNTDNRPMKEIESELYREMDEGYEQNDFVDGICVDALASGTSTKAKLLARDNALKLAAHLRVLQSADKFLNPRRPLPDLTLPGGNEKYLHWRFTAPSVNPDPENFPGKEEVQGLLRKINYLAQLRPMVDATPTLIAFQQTYKAWGIEVGVAPEDLALRESEAEERQEKRRSEAETRKREKARLQVKWEQMQGLKQRMIEISEENLSKKFVAELVLEDFHNRVKKRANNLYRNEILVDPSFVEEMKAPGGDTEKAVRNATGYSAFLEVMGASIAKGKPWEFPREVALVERSLEPILQDKSRPASTADHLKAVARQLLRMKLRSEAKDKPGAPRALLELMLLAPFELIPGQMSCEQLGIQTNVFSTEEVEQIRKMLEVPRLKACEMAMERVENEKRTRALKDFHEEPSLEDPEACIRHVKLLARRGAEKTDELEEGEISDDGQKSVASAAESEGFTDERVKEVEEAVQSLQASEEETEMILEEANVVAEGSQLEDAIEEEELDYDE